MITAVNSSSYSVLSLNSLPAKKETVHSTTRPDGLYKIHIDSTNLTLNVATVCPELNATEKACVAVIFNEDFSELVETEHVAFSDSLSPDVYLITVTTSQPTNV